MFDWQTKKKKPYCFSCGFFVVVVDCVDIMAIVVSGAVTNDTFGFGWDCYMEFGPFSLEWKSFHFQFESTQLSIWIIWKLSMLKMIKLINK